MPQLWAGTDAGKAEHHCTAIDTDGKTLLSRRVPNSETELLKLLRLQRLQERTDPADGLPDPGRPAEDRKGAGWRPG